ncbi:MAG: host attachment protein [Acidiferrobacterales bacterium]
MSEYCVVIADGARARLFTLEPAESPDMEGGPNLKERQHLVNPERVHTGPLWSDAKTGRNRAPAGGQAHGYDDHRTQHVHEFKRRFARSVAQQTARLVQAYGARSVILAAQKRMLGFLRGELGPLLKNGVHVHAIAKDLCKFAPHDVHKYLSKETSLPPRKNPAG